VRLTLSQIMEIIIREIDKNRRARNLFEQANSVHGTKSFQKETPNREWK